MLNPNSKPLRVSVVCRANEVRSRIMEGYLQKRFPQLEVRSFGTDAVKENRISSHLTREMNDWGVEIRQTPPASIYSNLDFIKASDTVISADSRVSEELSREGIFSINVCDFAVDEQHIPFDPIDFSSDKYLANAAKVLHCTAKMVSEVFDEQSSENSIWAYSTSESSIQGLLRPGAIVIDARFRKSAHQSLPSGDTRYFEEQELLDRSLISTLVIGTKVYASKFEIREPEKILLSNDWSDFVREVSRFGPVNVITAPLVANGRALSEPYLASLVADYVEYG